MTGSIAARLYWALEGPGTARARAAHALIVSLILVNVALLVLETEEGVAAAHGALLDAFETFSVSVFAAEYAARLATCGADPRYGRGAAGRARFALTPMMLVDLAAILPFFLPFLMIDVRFLRLLRLFRLFTVFKLARYSEPLKTLGDVFSSKAGDLAVAFLIFFIVLVFASSLMYHAEHAAQPEAFSSILASMWWGVVTLSTIGYGDTYPVTDAGKVIGAAVAVLGLAVYAIPTGILASAFIEELRRKRESGNGGGNGGGGGTCPHCGGEIGGAGRG